MENDPNSLHNRDQLRYSNSQMGQPGIQTGPGSGPTDLIRLLLMIIRSLLSVLGETWQIIELQRREIIELQVRLNKVNRVFSPKNEGCQGGRTADSESTKKKKRGAQPGHKPTKRNISDVKNRTEGQGHL